MMPGMSGDQLVQALRAHEELCDVPAVILTARADDALRVAALRRA
jgi:CheY-like chemotaxis protein